MYSMSRSSALVSMANRQFDALPPTVVYTNEDLEISYCSKCPTERTNLVLCLIEKNMSEYTEWNLLEKRNDVSQCRFLFANLGEFFCGFLSFKFVMEDKRPVMYVYELQVDPAFVGRQIGTQLLKAAESFCVQNCGISEFFLTCSSKNLPAIHFYQKMNFHTDKSSPGNAKYVLLSKKFTKHPNV